MMTTAIDTETPMLVSNSTIQTFKRCRRKWMLTYIDKLTKREETYVGPLPLGSRLHEAIEHYYKGEGAILDIWARLCTRDRVALLSSDMTADSEEAFDKEAELGRIMLEGFVEWVDTEGIDAGIEIVSNEERLSALVLDGRVELQAKIDMRVKRRSDGVMMVRDFKSAASIDDLTRSMFTNEQLLTYMVIENIIRSEGERCDGGELLILKKVKRSARAKPPFYERAQVFHNTTTLNNFWFRLAGVLTDMLYVRDQLRAGVDHRFVAYPRPTRDCAWDCPFITICPMFDDGSAVDRAITDLYRVADPYEYYESSTLPA